LFSSDTGDAVPYSYKKVCFLFAALAGGLFQTTAFADEPETSKSAVYAGAVDSFKACLEKASRLYFQEWSAARTQQNGQGPPRFNVPLKFKPIDEASKIDILTRFKRGMSYCRRVRDFALEHFKAEFGDPPSNLAPLQTLIAKETEEMLKADAKDMTDALRDIILGPDKAGSANFINMIRLLKELDGYRRQSIAEVFALH
jgi:hypothetical protein